MKVIIVVEIDPDKVLDAHTGGDIEDIQNTSLESAVEGELGWAEGSGIFVKSVIFPNEFKPNDSDFGNQLRNLLK